MSEPPSTPIPSLDQIISGLTVSGGSQAATGIFHGPVSFGSSSASRPPAKPSSTIPFRRDDHFVNRGTLLQDIAERCSKPAGRAALVGLGGVGKSQLAIEYAQRVKEESPETWLFWVFASDMAGVEAAYKEIAVRLQLCGSEDKISNIVPLVKDWLANENNGKWLMIIDNLDDAETLHAKLGQSEDSLSLAKMVPQSSNGAILITSRNTDAAREMVEEHEILPVGAMKESEAADLLRKKLGGSRDEEEADLLASLDYFPLAITQAAAYIKRQQITVSMYSRKLQSFHAPVAVLQRNSPNLRRDEKAASSLLRTWYTSFEQIKSECPDAIGLLSLMSFFNSQAVPKAMLKGYSGHFQSSMTTSDGASTRQGGMDSNDIEQLDEHLAVLYSFSMISPTRRDEPSDTEEEQFDMHALVQLATREWLKSMNVEEEFWERFLLSMFSEWTVKQRDLPFCLALLPHVQSIAERQPSNKRQSVAKGGVMRFASKHSAKQGLFFQAEKFARISLAQATEVHGKDHQRTLFLVNFLAHTLYKQGKFEEARTLNRQVLAGYESAASRDEGFQSQAMYAMLSSLRAQGQYEDMSSIHRLVAAGAEKELRDSGSMSKQSKAYLLVLVLNDQGKYKEAEEMARETLRIRQKEEGKGDPSTFFYMRCISRMQFAQGKYRDAEATARHVLELMEKTLGTDDLKTLNVVNDLAMFLFDGKRYEESETLARRVMEGRKSKLDGDYPETLESIANLAHAVSACGREAEAETLYEEAYEGFKRRFGEHAERHRVTVEVRKALANLRLLREPGGFMGAQSPSP